MQRNSAHDRKHGFVIRDIIGDACAQVARDRNQFGVRTIGYDSLADGEAAHVSADLGNDAHVAVAKWQRLVQFAAHRIDGLK